MLSASILHAIFDLTAWAIAIVSCLILYKYVFRERYDLLGKQVGGLYFVSLSFGSALGAISLGSLNLYLSGEAEYFSKSIIGALIGAIIAVEVYKSFNNINTSTGALLAIPFALAVGVGRWGCFLSGLGDHTHGIVTNSLWGHDFGDGVLRHPVQIYESVTLLSFALFLCIMFYKKKIFYMNNAFYLCVLLYASQRFAWEFLKPYATVVGPLNLFHLLCIGLVLYSLQMIRKSQPVSLAPNPVIGCQPDSLTPPP